MTQVLETKRLILRPVETHDFPILDKWRSTKDYLEFVFSREQKNYHLQFIISLKKDNVPIGVAYTFSYNKSDGFMFFNIFIEKGHRKNGYGAEACTIAICYIFDYFPIFKIYCDAFSVNKSSIAMMEGVGLEREGFLKGHRLFNGVRYDVVRFAIYRSNLERIRLLLQKFMKKRAD